VDHVAIYDPKRDRMLVLGGGQSSVWSLTLRPSPAWQILPTTGTSPPAFRSEMTAIYDPIGDRILTFSGTSTVAVWGLNLSSSPAEWTPWTPSGAVPPAGQDYSAVYDPVADRAIIFGFDGLGNRTWSLEFGRPVPALAALVSAEATGGSVRVTWQLPGGAGSRAEVEKMSEASGWSVVGEVFADGSGLATFEDTAVSAGQHCGYRLRMGDTYAAEVWVDVPTAATALRVLGAQPNPARRIALAFSLASNSPAKLQVYDLRGRLVAERKLEGLGSGSHVLSLPEAEGLGSGLYVVRLIQDGASATQRVTILR
jgi:hypothetical protein